jgi:hypothetical protein
MVVSADREGALASEARPAMGRALGVPTAIVALEVSGGEVELLNMREPNPTVDITTLVMQVYPSTSDLGNLDGWTFRRVNPK